MNSATRIIVGMSGGVDSSVTALLLKQQGYSIEGLFMKNWEEEGDTNCTANQDLLDAQTICLKLGIRLHTVNFSADYWDKVFIDFLKEYKAGRTPNPDILCNQEIKFKTFLNYALQLGADKIATGHYARCQKLNSEFQLLKGIDSAKDQSYFLYRLTQKQLAHALFPLGDWTKSKVRVIAQNAHFPNANKKGSTGICFIGERKFRNFLQNYLPTKPGPIETDQGQIIGQHIGLMYYTIGQRQGIGIGGIAQTQEAPWYVLEKDLKRNTLIIGQNANHPRLFSKQLIAHSIHWINEQVPVLPYACQAKIRYRQADQNCTIEKIENDQMEVTFQEPQRAITPGQSIVFYQESICLGGGIIL